MKRFALLFFILMIGSIIISSFYYASNDAVKKNTKKFIQEIIEQQYSKTLTNADNEKIKAFFQSFQTLDLPHPIIDGVDIPYFDVFTHPTNNNSYSQYISVKYEDVTDSIYDTYIYFEYISYSKDGNINEIFFGQLVIRTSDVDQLNQDLIMVNPMEKQK
ncbi:hypothetical protein [Anaerobacillus alkalilacustris]|nr:hypothetical protein [Anaerobacillus alkalilacustris]